MLQTILTALFLSLSSKLTRAYNSIGHRQIVSTDLTRFTAESLGNFSGKQSCHVVADKVSMSSVIIRKVLPAQRSKFNATNRTL